MELVDQDEEFWHIAPFRKSAQRIDKVMDYIRVRVFLPAAEIGILKEVPRAAFFINGIEREIKRLAGLAREFL
jgi:hypothetical protein